MYKSLIENIISEILKENIAINQSGKVDVNTDYNPKRDYKSTVFTDSRQDALGRQQNKNTFQMYRNQITVDFPIINKSFEFKMRHKKDEGYILTKNVEVKSKKKVKKKIPIYSAYAGKKSHMGLGQHPSIGKRAPGSKLAQIKRGAFEPDRVDKNSFDSDFSAKILSNTVSIAKKMMDNLKPYFVVYPDTSSNFTNLIVQTIANEYKSDIEPFSLFAKKFSFLTSFDENYFDKETEGYLSSKSAKFKKEFSRLFPDADQTADGFDYYDHLPKEEDDSYLDPKWDDIKKIRSRLNTSEQNADNIKGLKIAIAGIKDEIENLSFEDDPTGPKFKLKNIPQGYVQDPEDNRKTYYIRMFGTYLSSSIKDLFHVIQYFVDDGEGNNTRINDSKAFEDTYRELFELYLDYIDENAIDTWYSAFKDTKFKSEFYKKLSKYIKTYTEVPQKVGKETFKIGHVLKGDAQENLAKSISGREKKRRAAIKKNCNSYYNDHKRSLYDGQIENVLQKYIEWYVKNTKSSLKNSYIVLAKEIADKINALLDTPDFEGEQTVVLTNKEINDVFKKNAFSFGKVNRQRIGSAMVQFDKVFPGFDSDEISKSGEIVNKLNDSTVRTMIQKCLDEINNGKYLKYTSDFIAPILIVDDSLRTGTTIKMTIDSIVNAIESEQPNTGYYESADKIPPIVGLAVFNYKNMQSQSIEDLLSTYEGMGFDEIIDGFDALSKFQEYLEYNSISKANIKLSDIERFIEEEYKDIEQHDRDNIKSFVQNAYSSSQSIDDNESKEIEDI